jgi:DNA-binding NarL/FixJ family response regulator
MRSLLQAVIALDENMSVVGEAADGNAAIAQAELLQPDVILLDLAMPLRTGLEALPAINRVAPSAKVIILSGFAASVVEDELLGNGVAGYLQKGVDPEEILAAIETAAARGR